MMYRAGEAQARKFRPWIHRFLNVECSKSKTKELTVVPFSVSSEATIEMISSSHPVPRRRRKKEKKVVSADRCEDIDQLKMLVNAPLPYSDSELASEESGLGRTLSPYYVWDFTKIKDDMRNHIIFEGSFCRP